MSQARRFEIPGRYPGASPDNSDDETFHSGESDSAPPRRTLDEVRSELSQKKALLQCLPPEDTHPLDIETLQAEIISLQEEFDKLTMEQGGLEQGDMAEAHMRELLQAYNSSHGVVSAPGAVHGVGMLEFNPLLPRQDSMRKRTYSQVDQSPQDGQAEDFRRLIGPSYNIPPPLSYMPQVPFIPIGSTGLDDARSVDAINNDMYMPMTQVAGPSNPRQISQQQQISHDEEYARHLQNQEVIDLTGDDDSYDPAALSAAYQQYAPSNQFGGVGTSSYSNPMTQNKQFNNSRPRVKIEPRNSSSRGFGDWSVFKEDPDILIQDQYIPPPNLPHYTGLGVSDNPVILDDDDDDDYDDGGLDGFMGLPHGFPFQQFGQAFPQNNLAHFQFPNNASQNFGPYPLYNDLRHRTRDEQEDVKKLLEHLSEDTESKSPSDRIQTPPELSIKLMEHQKIGLTWLVKQEESGNKGGILADDMGLGKTIQAIALIVHRRSSRPHHKTTLIVCPVALMAQWQREIQAKVKAQHSLATYIYHGTQPKRYKNFNALKEFDVVLTSYGTLAGEFKKKQAWIAQKRTKFPPEEFPFLSSESTWYRVILDESQHVKNHRTQASRACADLMATYRLCLSGTPMQNNIDDLFGAVRFLHLARYREYRDWNRDFGSRIKLGRSFAADAMQRLQALIKAIMLRRKKDSLIDGKPLLVLPPKNIELIHPVFSSDEQEIYKAVEQKVQLRFNKYIENGSVLRNYTYVLLLLLRLRQVCCHPKMIKDLSVKITDEEKERQANLVYQLNPAVVERVKADPVSSCPICFDTPEKITIVFPCGHCFCEDCLTGYVNNQFAQMADGEEGNRPSCPSCRGPFDPSTTISWQVFKEIHMPDDGSELQQELEGLGNQLDNVLGGQILSDDSDSDSDSDSETDSDEDSDLGGFIVADDEVESDVNDESSEDETKGLNETRSRFSPVPPARIKRETGSSRQNGVKKEEEDFDDFPATQHSFQSISSGLKSEEDLPNDIWEEFRVKSEVKDEVKDEAQNEVKSENHENGENMFQFVEYEAEDVKPNVKKERKEKKGKRSSTKRKGKGKKPVQKRSQKPKKTKEKKKKAPKRVLNLSDKRALAVRNKKARKKYFRELAKDWHSSAKIEKVREILRSVRQNDPTEKTIIFSSFTSFLDLLSIPLDREDKFDFERYDGSMSAKDRNDAVLNFTENPDVTVMLVSLKAGNSGLNLTVASHVIIIDPWWNPYVEEQAIDRAHRIGQTRPVFVHRLIIQETVEDRILTLQDQKREIISAAMDEDAIKGLNRLSVRDLMYLFTGTR
ncbi:hypothetical protein TWF281_002008 [Arthrobotrys megalospora]